MSLSGKTIVVTRDAKQAESFVKKLKIQGAKVFLFPTIIITMPDNPNNIAAEINSAKNYDWIIFTSANSVKYFIKFYTNKKSELDKTKIGCIGKITAEKLKSHNLKPFLIPEINTAAGLLQALEKYEIKNKKILLPVSNIARHNIEKNLKSRGANITRIEIYKNIVYDNPDKETMRRKISEGKIDCITFFSPSAINSFFSLMDTQTIDLINSQNIPIAVIGSTTEDALKKHNLNPAIKPRRSDVDSLISELNKFFQNNNSNRTTINE